MTYQQSQRQCLKRSRKGKLSWSQKENLSCYNLQILYSREWEKHPQRKKHVSRRAKRCFKGSIGCRDQPIINKTITEDVNKKNKGHCKAYIDNILDTLILVILTMNMIAPMIVILYLNHSMNAWQTVPRLQAKEGPKPSRSNKNISAIHALSTPFQIGTDKGIWQVIQYVEVAKTSTVKQSDTSYI